MCQYVTQEEILKTSLLVAKTFKVVNMKREEMKLSSNFLERYDHTKKVWIQFLSDKPMSSDFDDDNFNWLFAINFNLSKFSEAPSYIRDDKDVAYALINSNKFVEWDISSYKYLTKRVKSDRRIWIEALKRTSGVLFYFDEDFLLDENFYLTLFRRKDWFSLIGEVREDHPLINCKILSKISFARVRLEVRLLIYLVLKEIHGENIFQIALILKILDLKPWQANHAEELLRFHPFGDLYFTNFSDDQSMRAVNYLKREIRTRCLKEGKKCSLCYPSL